MNNRGHYLENVVYFLLIISIVGLVYGVVDATYTSYEIEDNITCEKLNTYRETYKFSECEDGMVHLNPGNYKVIKK